MDHLTRCILFVLSSVPLTLGISMIVVGVRKNTTVQKIIGIAITVVSALAYWILGLGMLLSLRLGYLMTGILISAPLGCVLVGLNNALDKNMSGGFLRGLLRFLLTALHLAVCVGSMMLVGHEETTLGILVSLDVAAALGLYWIFWKNHRAKKLAASPVMRRVIKLCREHKCAAIQLLPDRVRLFDHLPSEDYCRSSFYNSHSLTFVPPDHWAPWFAAGSWCHEVIFADFGYPGLTVEQLELCALGLKKKLKGFRSCRHHSTHRSSKFSHEYDETGRSFTVNNVRVTHLHEDQLLYRTALLQSADKNQHAKQQRSRRKTQEASGQNSWE